MADFSYVHSCTIVSKTQTSQDEFGEPIYSSTTTSTPCRFYFTNSNSRIINPESGKHSVTTPAVMLPGTVSVYQGNTITSSNVGFSHSYEVKSVKPVYWLFYATVHHYECELEAVE